jgi:peptidoglycan biosynthesis protein MviN/MurJ (putative lipid II flippase)
MGEFGSGDVELGARVLLISSFALPFYALAAYLVKAFHSRKDMKIPLFGAMISFIVNVVMSILLMYEYGMYGLAWANVFAAFIQTVFLGWKFKKVTKESFFEHDGLFFIPILTASTFMFLLLWAIEQSGFFGGGKLNEVFVLIFMIFCGVIVYGAILFILKFPELRNYSRKVRSVDFKNHG